MIRPGRAAIAALALAIVLAACGDDTANDPSPTAPTSAAPASSGPLGETVPEATERTDVGHPADSADPTDPTANATSATDGGGTEVTTSVVVTPPIEASFTGSVSGCTNTMAGISCSAA